ncbi:hypothetical protein [Geothrix sp. 21YS21S-2]|uniref:hypothetical protein n=1 Tax=Geothrix sp. 21YS21S-2 TaxID=3068893 RepID=UPI0027BAB8A5|nr:hypothetical protein [Geothrix sp. 21YS21S-2]
MFLDPVYHVAVQAMPHQSWLSTNGLSALAATASFLAAGASWLSVYWANKARKEELDRSKPDLQFGYMNVEDSSSVEKDFNMVDLKFMLYNTKRNKIQSIEQTIFITYPSNVKKDTSRYHFDYMIGTDGHQIDLQHNILPCPEPKSLIIMMLKTTDVFGNTGENIFTLYFIIKGMAIQSGDEMEMCMKERRPVLYQANSAGQLALGETAFVPYLHPAIIDRLVICLTDIHDDKIDKMLFDKDLINALRKFKFRKILGRFNIIKHIRVAIKSMIHKMH